MKKILLVCIGALALAGCNTVVVQGYPVYSPPVVVAPPPVVVAPVVPVVRPCASVYSPYYGVYQTNCY